MEAAYARFQKRGRKPRTVIADFNAQLFCIGADRVVFGGNKEGGCAIAVARFKRLQCSLRLLQCFLCRRGMVLLEVGAGHGYAAKDLPQLLRGGCSLAVREESAWSHSDVLLQGKGGSGHACQQCGRN
jgi:hypothetical protein